MGKHYTKDDPFVITQREHDPDSDAKRVIIVGGEMPTFNVQAGSTPNTEIRIERIEVPVVIVQKELQIERVEIPIVIEKIVEVIREVPVVRTEVQVIEKPIIIKETQVQELSKTVRVFLAVNSLATIILLIKLILK